MPAVYKTQPFRSHVEPAGHPERVERLDAVDRVFTSLRDNLDVLEPTPCRKEDLLLVHSREHVETARAACAKGMPLGLDTYTSTGSWDAALAAAGSSMNAVEEILTGSIKAAFIPTRPPGHHAEPDQAMGFCLFNNIAIAAAHALKKGAGNVAIIDWDVHHGNGTQAAFYESPDVFYFSIHQYPLYPGTGWPEETGAGEGRGFTLNVQMAPGSSAGDWMEAYGRAMDRVAEFKCGLLLVSCGFDAHELDPISHQHLRGEHYAAMTERALDIAEKTETGGIISLLEGGYSLEGLKEGLSSHLKTIEGRIP